MHIPDCKLVSNVSTVNSIIKSVAVVNIVSNVSVVNKRKKKEP